MLSDLFSLAVVELPFGQTVGAQDFAVVGLLVVLEGVLSIDNALVLGILAKKLPKHLQGKALTYGLVGALVFRLIAVSMATLLMKWWVVKLLGGGYLVYIGLKHLLFAEDKAGAHEVKVGVDGHPHIEDELTVPADGEAETEVLPYSRGFNHHAKLFWSTVLVIELTDVAFAVDSILAAIALVANTTKTWVVIVGGLLGVVLMRFAAIVFIKLLDRFPRFEAAAYLLVTIIGGKLLVDWWFNKRPENAGAHWHAPVDFHSLTVDGQINWPFAIFWLLMLGSFLVGFLPAKQPAAELVASEKP